MVFTLCCACAAVEPPMETVPFRGRAIPIKPRPASVPADAGFTLATLARGGTVRGYIEADEETRRALATVSGIWLQGSSRWSAVVVDWTGLGVLSHEGLSLQPGLPAMKSVLHVPQSDVVQSMIQDGITVASCVVRFDIDAYGHVAHARIAETSGYPGADEAALKSIQTFEYGPAANEGRPVPLHTDRRFEWRVEHRPRELHSR